MDNAVLQHAAQNALVGGIIGAAIGGGIGYATAGPIGATRGAVAGAVGGSTVSGFVTYYVEHREANALADINARNRKLIEYLQAYQGEDAKLRQQTDDLKALLVQTAAHDLQMKERIRTERENNEAFLQRVQGIIASMEAERQQFESAIQYAKTHNVPVNVDAGLLEHQNEQSRFRKIEQDTKERLINNFENGRYE